MTQQRALLAIRLSVRTDETTSPERQEDACRAAATHYGLAVAGVASDIDVSATKTTPWERPELGEWLNDRSHEFDAVIWWKLDRAVRSMADMSELVRWARTHGKRLIFAEGPGGGSMELDLTGRSPVAELLSQVFAFAAQMEALSISERIAGTHAAMSRMPYRWSGGTSPYGYQAVPNPHGPGRTLARDPDETKVLNEVIQRVHEGEAVAAIAVDLNTRKIYPRQRIEGAMWHASQLDTLLRSPALMGHKTHGRPGRAVSIRDDDGRPVLQTDDPVLTGDEFEALQQVLNSRRRAKVDRRDTDSLLLGVVHCASCGKRMYFNRSRTGRTEPYACSIYKSGVKCPGAASIKGTTADEYATEKFLDVFGRVEYTETIEHGGDDPRPEIARTAEELDLMASQLANASSDAERQVWKARVTALGKRLAELESRPIVEPWTEQRPTGQTIADVWAQATTSQRRGMLREAGARLWVYPRKQRPTDRMEFVVTASEWAQLAESLSTIATDESD